MWRISNFRHKNLVLQLCPPPSIQLYPTPWIQLCPTPWIQLCQTPWIQLCPTPSWGVFVVKTSQDQSQWLAPQKSYNTLKVGSLGKAKLRIFWWVEVFFHEILFTEKNQLGSTKHQNLSTKATWIIWLPGSRSILQKFRRIFFEFVQFEDF